MMKTVSVIFFFIVTKDILVSGDNINFPSRTVELPSTGEVWPKPQIQEVKDQYVAILQPFRMKIVGKTNCKILEEAIRRYTNILKTSWRKITQYDDKKLDEVVPKTDTLKIFLDNPCEEYPSANMDERYELEIKEKSCVLSSKSIWGILRGLETFSQLPFPTKKGNQLLLQVQKIEDYPSYPHRGLLLDSARHYLPVETIKKQLDAMAANKMNVFHWHLIDDQSFPYQSKKYPELTQKGAFDPDYAVYTHDHIKSIIEYARLRGIRVIPEFDTPGHTDSLEKSHPELHCHCPYPPTDEDKKNPFVGPMDPTKNETMEFMTNLVKEIKDLFPEKYLHIGGDEVDSFCWKNNPEIKKYLNDKNWNTKQLQSFYTQQILKMLKSINLNAVVWEEVFSQWQNLNGEKSKAMDKETIVQLWKSHDISAVTKEGYKVLSSNGWYLDNLANDFFFFYNLDINVSTLSKEEKKLVLGGEACMWGEFVDETNIESRIWPRASAVAEKLWSRDQSNEIVSVKKRIEEHVCRMKRRNIMAAPVKDISFCSPVIKTHDFEDVSLFKKYSSAILDTIGLSNDDGKDKNYYQNNEVKQDTEASKDKIIESKDTDTSTTAAPNTSSGNLISSTLFSLVIVMVNVFYCI